LPSARGQQHDEELPVPAKPALASEESVATPPPDASSLAQPSSQFVVPLTSSIPIVASLPTIAAVHETGQPAVAHNYGASFRIRGRRFEVDVKGIDPSREYQLVLLFDDERIGATDWVGGRDRYTVATSFGFPPGRYRLSVQVVAKDGVSPTIHTPSVRVDFQPTYWRDFGKGT